MLVSVCYNWNEYGTHRNDASFKYMYIYTFVNMPYWKSVFLWTGQPCSVGLTEAWVKKNPTDCRQQLQLPGSEMVNIKA